MNQTIMGIDPGSRITGYGLVSTSKNRLTHIENGLIVPKQSELSDRITWIFNHLTAIISRFQPTVIVLENIFVAKNNHSALILGHARGVAMLAARLHGISLIEYSPRSIKQAIVGHGGASKEQIQKMVKVLLCLPEPPATDASDALAAAICHAHSAKTEKILHQKPTKLRM